MNKHSFALILLGLLQVMPAHASGEALWAEELPFSLDDLLALDVTISTNTKQGLSKAPSVVTLITEQDIKATGATNLVEVLEGVPGIHVRASQFGFRPLVHFRGTNATQTLLMINGAPVKDLSWGFGIFWKGIPASAIDRIEIIRGPGSALFGSDAASGVINVITKTAKQIKHDEAGVRLGSYNARTGWLQHGGEWNGKDIGLTAELFGTDGHDPFIARDKLGQAGIAEYGWKSADVRFSIGRENWRVLADYSGHADLETGLAGAGVLDPVTQAHDSRYGVEWLYNNQRFGEHLGLNAEVRFRHVAASSGNGFQEEPSTGVNSPFPLINRLRTAESKLSAEVSGLYSGFRSHALRVGVGGSVEDLYSVEHLKNDNSGQFLPLAQSEQSERSRQIGYVFAQDVWTLSESWELTAGARYDDYSDFGGTFNPRLAVVWHSTDRLTTKLMYGQAFRAPTYVELYAGSISNPNPALAPERSRTWDLAFSYAASKGLRLDLGVFRIEQSDLIAPDATNTVQNAGDHTIRGVELEARWQATPDLMIAGNYTHRDHSEALYRDYTEPDWEAYLRTDWAFRPKWTWSLQANWVGQRVRKSTDARAPLDGYALVDTTLRFVPAKNWEFAASIRNLLDVDAREYTGPAIRDDLPLPGRNAYAELRYKF